MVLSTARQRDVDEPRIIQTPDGAAARGSFTVEAATGRVIATELVIGTGAISATIRVTFAEQAAMALWLPIRMEERYAIGPRGDTVEGRADYANFRRFAVTTSTGVKQ